MKNITQFHSRVTSIYPGIYQPVFTKDQDVVKVKSCKPPVNIIEFSDYYQIEMPAPGFQKDQFFIKTKGDSLLIAGYKKRIDKTSEARYRQQGFHCKFIARNVDLPSDADTEFGIAEYKNGVLYIYLYKASCPVQNRQNFIVVY